MYKNYSLSLSIIYLFSISVFAQTDNLGKERLKIDILSNQTLPDLNKVFDLEKANRKKKSQLEKIKHWYDKQQMYGALYLTSEYDTNPIEEEIQTTSPTNTEDFQFNAFLSISKPWKKKLIKSNQESTFTFYESRYLDTHSLNLRSIGGSHTIFNTKNLKSATLDSIHRIMINHIDNNDHWYLWSLEYAPSFYLYQKKIRTYWVIDTHIRNSEY